MNRNEAVKLISDFLKDEDEKPKTIDDLKTFSFWDIKNKKKYGNGESKHDADRTKLAYAIDYLLYAESNLPDFNIAITYSGETLNTVNTLFSSQKPNRYKMAELSDDKGDFLKKVFDENNSDHEDFYHVYQRLGNLTLLPCKTIGGGSINTLKGFSPEIKDYFYKFMINLKDAYVEKEKIKAGDYFDLIRKDNREFKEELLILMQVNHFFFDKITFDKFVEVFMLEGWENLELDDYLRYSKVTEGNIKIALDYVKKAKKFINNRTGKIIKKLKEIEELKEFSKE